jgi:hypothetical protein
MVRKNTHDADMEDTLRAHILSLAAAFEQATGSSWRTIGKVAMNDNTFFVRIGRGDGFTIRTFDRILQWFSDNWPENAEWPEGIERPVRTGVAA